MRARSRRNLEEAPPSSAAAGTGSIPSPLTLSGSYEPPELLEVRDTAINLASTTRHSRRKQASDPPAVVARRARSRRHVSRSSSQPTDPVPCQRQIHARQSTQSPRLAALSLADTTSGTEAVTLPAVTRRIPEAARADGTKGGVIRRGIIRITTHWGLPYLHQRSTEEGSVRRIRKGKNTLPLI